MAAKSRKKQVEVDVTAPVVEVPSLVIDGAMAAMQMSVSASAGSNNTIGAYAATDLVGIQLPSLMLEYILGTNVMPLSRFLQVVGEYGSCKSSFVYEMMRWITSNNGIAVLAENENKDASPLRNSIFHYDGNLLQRFKCYQTRCVEDWQTVVTRAIQGFRSHMLDPKAGVGAIYPVIIAVDSIKGTGLRAQIEGILEEGFAKLEYPKFAAQISAYLQSIVHQLGEVPILLVGTNHLKPGINPTMPHAAVETVAGGQTLKFMETYELRLERIARLEKTARTGVKIRFRTRKTSTGATNLYGDVCFVWENRKEMLPVFDEAGQVVIDTATGEPVLSEQVRQYSVWDWEEADIELILSFQSEQRKNKTLGKRLNDIVELTEHTTTRGRFVSSPVLGIKEKSPVSLTEAGALLHARPDVLTALRNELGINVRGVFRPGTNYMLQQEIEQRKQQAQLRHSNMQGLPTGESGVEA